MVVSFALDAITFICDHSRKRGPFPQNSDCEVDLSVDSANSVVQAHEKCLMLVCRIASCSQLSPSSFIVALSLVSRYWRLFLFVVGLNHEN